MSDSDLKTGAAKFSEPSVDRSPVRRGGEEKKAHGRGSRPWVQHEMVRASLREVVDYG